MKIKSLTTLVFCTLILTFFTYSQEALKSIEEEYYDFLSLQGITERPTLGYRTLSDSVWTFTELEEMMENEDGSFTKVRISSEQSDSNIWKNNNLGSWFTIWQPENTFNNFFFNGLKQGLFLRVYGPEWYNSYNTAAPYGQNDGALWQGRGYNTSLTAGLRLEGYGFELTFKPQVSFSQNLEFDYIPGVYGDPHSYNWSGNIDLVQQYGDSAFWNYDWADLEIRWNWHTFTLGFGTQNPWLGPAYLNPMLGSNNAAGYPKFDIGLRKTKVYIPGLDLYIGDIEGRIWTGMLTESDYFDNNSDNDYRMLNAMSASFTPSFIPGLTVGANRIFITNWATHNLKYIGRLFTLSHSNGSQVGTHEDEDQKVALFADWQFPKVGFDVYGEFGIDDFTSNEVTNPFHTAIYTLGVKQAIPLPYGLKSELNLEWNNFEMSQDFQLQWPYMGYYAHGSIAQGYTQKGQILGAGSGYFGNSQFIQYKVYYPRGFTAVKFHRYCQNNNSVYSKAVNSSSNNSDSELSKNWYANYETYICIGVQTNFFISTSMLVNVSFDFINIFNRLYQKYNDQCSFNFDFVFKYLF